MFIDLSEAFDTVDHSILLKKLELYGITDRNHGWVKNYLSNKRRFVQINEKEKNKLRDDQLWCSTRVNFRTAPISYVCERLKNASKMLDPIMFADDILFADYFLETKILDIYFK